MATGSIQFDVPLIPQPNTTSCWAASMAMLVSYRDGAMTTPQSIADAAGYSLESSYGWDALYSALREWNLSTITMTPTMGELDRLLRRYGPLWLMVTGAPTHAVVLTGGDGGSNFSWNDPWPPRTGRRSVHKSASQLAARFGAVSTSHFQIVRT